MTSTHGAIIQKNESVLPLDLPCVSLAFLPTPLEELPRLRTALGENCPRLFIKRDDQTGLVLCSPKIGMKKDRASRSFLDFGSFCKREVFSLKAELQRNSKMKRASHVNYPSK